MVQWQPFGLLPLAGALIATAVGVVAWRRRGATPAASALALLMFGAVEWAGTDAIGAFATSVEAKTALGLARFPGLAAVTLGFCWLCRSMINRERLPRPLLALLAVEPILITVAAATNHLHHGVFASTELVGHPSLLRITFGPLWYLQNAYNYTVVGVSLAAVVQTWRTTSHLRRRQLTTVLIAAAFPVAGQIATVVNAANGGGGDFADLGVLAAGLLAAWAVFRQGQARLVPIAHSLVLERVSDVVVVIDVDGRVLEVNPAAVSFLHRTRPDLPPNLIGLPANALLGDGATGPFADGGHLVDGEYTVPVQGRQVDLDVRSSHLTYRGASVGRVIVARDITELNDQKRALRIALAERDALEQAVSHQAFHDSLTGLPNRALFTDRLTKEYARARRYGLAVVVMLVDLDDFKPVNDALGHHAGDLLLREVGERLRSSVREVDTVARLGGDEFAIVLCRPRQESVTAVAERVMAIVGMPFLLEGKRIAVHASVGVAVDDGAGSVPQLLRDADTAMYDAKRRGKGQYAIFQVPDVEMVAPAALAVDAASAAA